MNNEYWKSIFGYEGYYEVSNIGTVRRKQTGKILKPRISNGYCMVDLRVNGKRRYHPIGRYCIVLF